MERHRERDSQEKDGVSASDDSKKVERYRRILTAIRAAGMSSYFFFGVPSALLWLYTGYKVGRRHDRHEPA